MIDLLAQNCGRRTPGLLGRLTSTWSSRRRVHDGGPDEVWLRTEELLLWYGEAAADEARNRSRAALVSNDSDDIALWRKVRRDAQRREAQRAARARRSSSLPSGPRQMAVSDRLILIARSLIEMANGEAGQCALNNACAAAWQLLDLCPTTPGLRNAIDALTHALTAIDQSRPTTAHDDVYPDEVLVASRKLLELRWWATRNRTKTDHLAGAGPA